ncbi:MAG: SDR family NAD(P)-dependent oxidoreductase [Clostridia bacterium]|nr:SDR family NAD(P)-dependent oxidoreductase [Clostridia bacterium]
MNSLKGKVAVVTGGSRGVGKGIALGLAEYGATVYVTGRGESEMLPSFLSETSIFKTVEEIEKIGGVGISHQCDHSNDNEVEALFLRIIREQGKLDILVNNAWGGSMHAMRDYFFNTPFWNQPVSLWDDHHMVGVRSNYVAGRYAAQIMSKQKKGIIANISYYGGRRYMNNVAYGVSKAAVDRLSADMAYELKDYGVSVFSIYPGQVSTEGMKEYAKYNPSLNVDEMETPQFVGRCIAALSMDNNVIKETGKILITAELAEKYNITDINGKKHKSMKSALW